MHISKILIASLFPMVLGVAHAQDAMPYGFSVEQSNTWPLDELGPESMERYVPQHRPPQHVVPQPQHRPPQHVVPQPQHRPPQYVAPQLTIRPPVHARPPVYAQPARPVYPSIVGGAAVVGGYYYGNAPTPGYNSDAVSYCIQTYGDAFDINSMTYLGNDGLRYPCPS